MAKAVATKAKSKATKGDSSKPIAQSSQSSSGGKRPYDLKVPLPKITAQEAQTVAAEFLRDAYVETIKYMMDRKAGKVGEGEMQENEKDGIESLLKSFEQVIIWFDQSPQWLEDLHTGKLPNQKKSA